MKNPWMSAWLSAANQMAGASRGLWAAEAQRQQQAWAKAMTDAWTKAMAEAWTAPLGSSGRKSSGSRRHK